VESGPGDVMKRAFTDSDQLVLGVDIGGTKLAVGLVTMSGQVVAQERTPTQVKDGPEVILTRLVTLCRQVTAKAGVRWNRIVATGIGCGGPLENGVVKSPPNLPGWDDIPVAEFFSHELGMPAYLENDANAAALGEYFFGAGRGVANMVYLTISTGIGGGVITNGRLYRGENGNAAEIGHMVVVHGGRECYCGNRGCLEAYASGSSLARRAREKVQAAGQASRLPGLAGSVEAITAETLLQALELQDPLAHDIWNETVNILGSGLASVINLFNPRLVILGGGIINFGEWLFGPVGRIALQRAMKPLAKVADIVPAQLGAEVGIVGAAAVVLDKLQLLRTVREGTYGSFYA